MSTHNICFCGEIRKYEDTPIISSDRYILKLVPAMIFFIVGIIFFFFFFFFFCGFY